MSKKTRYNTKNQFESVYLRVNQIRKTIDSLPKDVIEEHLSDINFLKTARFLASRTFSKNKGILLAHGFDFEDIESITKVYAISFLGTNYGNKTGRDKYYLMMNYVGQRFEAFFLFLERKFSIKSKFAEIPIGNVSASSMRSCDISGDIAPRHDEEAEPSEEALIEQIEIVEAKLSELRAALKLNKKDDRARAQKSILRRQLLALKSHLAQVRREARDRRSEQRNLTSELRKRFKSDWKKHTDQLCYYSTSKYVPDDVRKKARLFCKKHKIDFVAWVKERIAKNSDEESSFVV